MSRNRAVWFAALGGLVAAVGCKHHVKYNTSVPVVEEFKEPPHEPRFDNPPEQGYQKAKTKKQQGPLGMKNAPGMPGAGGTMGGNTMGNNGMGRPNGGY